MPVAIFVMEPGTKNVSVKIDTDAHFEIVGSDTVSVNFEKPGEQLAILKLKVRPELGKGEDGADELDLNIPADDKHKHFGGGDFPGWRDVAVCDHSADG